MSVGYPKAKFRSAWCDVSARSLRFDITEQYDVCLIVEPTG
jgi:hypothetical protein